jgi:hypothetical protein
MPVMLFNLLVVWLTVKPGGLCGRCNVLYCTTLLLLLAYALLVGRRRSSCWSLLCWSCATRQRQRPSQGVCVIRGRARDRERPE